MTPMDFLKILGFTSITNTILAFLPCQTSRLSLGRRLPRGDYKEVGKKDKETLATLKNPFGKTLPMSGKRNLRRNVL